MKKILHKIAAFIINGAELKAGKEYVVLSSNI
jgi:hypothetical protein